MEKCIFISENLAGTFFLTASDNGITDYGIVNAIDNLEYTFYKTLTAGVKNFAIEAIDDYLISADCVAIRSEAEDAAAQVTIKVDGSTVFTKTGIRRGANLFRWTSGITSGIQVVEFIVDAGVSLYWRHFWIGLSLECKDPDAPFDPEVTLQSKHDVSNRANVLLHRSIDGHQKALRPSFSSLDGPSVNSLLALKQKAFDKELPFWFFFRPISQPNNGRMYWPQKNSFRAPVTKGLLRSASFEAKVAWIPPPSISRPSGPLTNMIFSNGLESSLTVQVTKPASGCDAILYVVIPNAGYDGSWKPIDGVNYAVGNPIGNGHVGAVSDQDIVTIHGLDFTLNFYTVVAFPANFNSLTILYFTATPPQKVYPYLLSESLDAIADYPLLLNDSYNISESLDAVPDWPLSLTDVYYLSESLDAVPGVPSWFDVYDYPTTSTLRINDPSQILYNAITVNTSKISLVRPDGSILISNILVTARSFSAPYTTLTLTSAHNLTSPSGDTIVRTN